MAFGKDVRRGRCPMQKKKWYWCALLAFGWLALGLALPAVGDPYFSIETEIEWDDAMAAGRITPVDPSEWSDYMDDWALHWDPAGEPYPFNEYVMPNLYVYGGGGSGG